jgi:hypothetical protein
MTNPPTPASSQEPSLYEDKELLKKSCWIFGVYPEELELEFGLTSTITKSKMDELMQLITKKQLEALNSFVESIMPGTVPLEYSLQGDNLKYESGWVDGFNACHDQIKLRLESQLKKELNK